MRVQTKENFLKAWEEEVLQINKLSRSLPLEKVNRVFELTKQLSELIEDAASYTFDK